jgi:hypothetical protein
MSDTAIQSGLYDELTNLADSVDDLLLRLRTGRDNPADPTQKRLADFLTRTSAEHSSTDLGTLRLLALLGYTDPKERRSWARVGEALRNGEPVPEAVVQRLEALGRQLEARRTEAVTKMRRRR